MKLVWSPEALNDRLAIFDFIAADNPRAALGMDELFLRAANNLFELTQRMSAAADRSKLKCATAHMNPNRLERSPPQKTAPLFG
ncbi:MAG: type II toxin-antitoxin system RelE/ParE family toxin [Asticcacaulis sp.]|uniref:type II toxin-antitoxin system RelE/ParE family toxin n=1 Tax=Asticcacaulis sp. TaxID=1872648 RepID=UPI003F7C94F4